MSCVAKVFIHKMYNIDTISNPQLIHRWWANLSVKIHIRLSLPKYEKQQLTYIMRKCKLCLRIWLVKTLFPPVNRHICAGVPFLCPAVAEHLLLDTLASGE